ncbi:MAG: hypothetical protein M5R40_24375 [Anaerolineae bacterium]|nr:hypothetical protein [Anaerolineae bacterium]
MFRKRLVPALLALVMVLAAGCDATEMEAFNASLRFLVALPDNVFDETIHNSDIDLMGRQIGEMMPVLRRATPEEAAEFNRLLMQLFQRIQQRDPELARRLAAHLLRAFLGVGGPANPPQGAIWRARAGVERTGDVYDYNLEQPVQNADSARADINHVTATATNKMGAVGPLHPGDRPPGLRARRGDAASLVGDARPLDRLPGCRHVVGYPVFLHGRCPLHLR